MGKLLSAMTTLSVRLRLSVPVLGLLVTVFLPMHVGAQAEPALTVQVDCAGGKTIKHALRQGDERKPLVVIIEGTCTENVTVDRDDITLVSGAAGGTVNGPDPDTATITVTASRVTIDGLTVTGGRNGIQGVGARAVTIANCIVQNTGQNGIFLLSSSGSVDTCTVRNNSRDGISVESASATIVNSSISQNARVGVLFTDGSSGRIGVTNAGVAAGNVIGNNGSAGIFLSLSSAAFVAANTISGNGTNPAASLGRNGIGVSDSRLNIVGLNVITGNANHGVFASGSSVSVGSTTFTFSQVNTISGNGTAVPSAGIFAFLGTPLVLRNAVISNNNGFGVVVSLRSSAQMSGNTIRNNTGAPGDGIRIVFGSGLFIDPPPAAANIVTGNSGWGLNCTDGEASVVNTGFLVLAPPANALGGVNPACTGF